MELKLKNPLKLPKPKGVRKPAQSKAIKLKMPKIKFPKITRIKKVKI